DGRKIPNKCRGIAAAGEQSFATREKSQRLDGTLVATKRPKLSTRRYVPKPDVVVPARGGQPRPVRRKSQGPTVCPMSPPNRQRRNILESAYFSPGRNVPLDEVRPARDDNGPAVGGECGRPAGSGARQFGDCSARSRIF